MIGSNPTGKAGLPMRTGLWLIGARGSVATTVAAGAAAVRAGLGAPLGCVTTLDDFQGVPLPRFDEVVCGGHDISDIDLVKRAEQLVTDGVLPAGLPGLVEDDLRAVDARIRRGTSGEQDIRPGDIVDSLAADLADFRSRNDLDSVVVVNVSSTEGPAVPHPAHASLTALRCSLYEEPHARAQAPVLPSSSLYAFAAFTAGCPYIDFTPSTGARLPALAELAHERGMPWAGSDGKTGETLVKSVLAPMFARRALRVRGWSGTNLLGGGDGATLDAEGPVNSKASSKAVVLPRILGYPVDGGVHIHNVPALGEWKTAWDHIVFEGFLGTRMSMQFTWQGCDSALAAPLVLDLARLMATAQRARCKGPVPELAFFFKDPVGSHENSLERQFTTLATWARGLRVGS
ncbi:inositol-3-phosphate synthase [Kitasatospora sp. NPDC057595]